MEEYTVRLPDYHGPLDLLLHLVKRNEVDVLDIPVGVIADQFRQHIDILKLIDMEAVGDFLVVAATLMEIKSRMLLPRAEGPAHEEAGEDPRRELVRQLLEYKRFKDAAGRLEDRARFQERRMPRGLLPESAADNRPAVHSPELWDLVSAFGRIIQEAAALEPQQIVTDETPHTVYVEQVLSAVRAAGRLAFRAVFTAPYFRLRLIGLFLAVLELIKNGDIKLEQSPEEEIMLVMA